MKKLVFVALAVAGLSFAACTGCANGEATVVDTIADSTVADSIVEVVDTFIVDTLAADTIAE